MRPARQLARRSEVAINSARRSEGAPLDRSTRALMENRFDSVDAGNSAIKSWNGASDRIDPSFEHQADALADRIVEPGSAGLSAGTPRSRRFDFGNVRIHSGPQSDLAARAMGAHAFTIQNDVFFSGAAYSPGTVAGQRLLAHELSHVLQQRTASVPGVQMKRADTCTSEWVCAGGDACNAPDVPPRADVKASSWTLKVMIDIEAETAADVGTDTVGHTYVVFSDSAGAVYSYGFYPNKSAGTPDPLRNPSVFGCMVHPDTAHKSCVDYEEQFSLTEEQYKKALAFAQLYCRSPEHYHLSTNNCTTFAVNVASIAGQSLPAVRGPVGPIKYDADNPNTLYDALKRRDVGPTYGLTSDSELRAAIAVAKRAQLTAMPVAEKIRVINRLLKGWVDDDDVSAIETLCGAVDDREHLRQVRDGTIEAVKAMNTAAQQRRVNAALTRL